MEDQPSPVSTVCARFVHRVTLPRRHVARKRVRCDRANLARAAIQKEIQLIHNTLGTREAQMHKARSLEGRYDAPKKSNLAGRVGRSRSFHGASIVSAGNTGERLSQRYPEWRSDKIDNSPWYKPRHSSCECLFFRRWCTYLLPANEIKHHPSTERQYLGRVRKKRTEVGTKADSSVYAFCFSTCFSLPVAEQDSKSLRAGPVGAPGDHKIELVSKGNRNGR